MTKKYDFNYEEGRYILQYNNPNSKEEPFVIDTEDMQFDTKKFYMYIFSDVKEQINIEIINNIKMDIVSPEIAKKGERVYKVIDDLCKEITKRINSECFLEVERGNES